MDRFDPRPKVWRTDTGEPWAAPAGAFSTSDGEARATTSQFSLASVEAGFAYGTYELTVNNVGDRRFWAVFRVVDSQNYYRVGPDAGGRYRLEKVVNGVVHGLQFHILRTEIMATHGDVIRIVNRPDDGMFVWINGEHLLRRGGRAIHGKTGFGFATASTEVRIGHVDVGQVMTSSVVVTDSFKGARCVGVARRSRDRCGLSLVGEPGPRGRTGVLPRVALRPRGGRCELRGG